MARSLQFASIHKLCVPKAEAHTFQHTTQDFSVQAVYLQGTFASAECELPLSRDASKFSRRARFADRTSIFHVLSIVQAATLRSVLINDVSLRHR